MSEPRNEAQLTARIVKAIEEKYPRAWLLKVHGGGYQRRGVPDLLVVLHGQMHGFEVKHRKPGESVGHMLSRVSESQKVEIKKLVEAGAVAAVVWSVEQVLGHLKMTDDAIGNLSA